MAVEAIDRWELENGIGFPGFRRLLREASILGSESRIKLSLIDSDFYEIRGFVTFTTFCAENVDETFHILVARISMTAGCRMAKVQCVQIHTR
jgi:hypothetical protein